MRVYISGPITGQPDGNRAAFEAAAVMLRAAGQIPINPHDLPIWLPADVDAEELWRRHMRIDIRELVACDAVYMLPGWPASRGARLEHHVAVELGLHVIDGDAAKQCLLRPSSDAAGFPPGASALGGLCLADGEGSET